MATVIPTGPEERCCKDAHQYKVLVCHCLSQLVRGCRSLQRVVRGYHKLSKVVTSCLSLSQLEADYLEGSRVAIVVLVLSAEAR